jgi:hypothetical protein
MEKKFDITRAKGLLYMFVSAIMATAMNVLIKYQSSTTKVTALQAIIFRNFFLAAGCFLHLSYVNVSIIGIPQKLSKFVFLRGAFGFIMTICHYSSYEFLPLSIAVTIVRS